MTSTIPGTIIFMYLVKITVLIIYHPLSAFGGVFMQNNYHVLINYLSTYCDELEPMEFYRMVFPQGELQEMGVYEKGKYNGIAVEVTREKKKMEKRRYYDIPLQMI